MSDTVLLTSSALQRVVIAIYQFLPCIPSELRRLAHHAVLPPLEHAMEA